MQSGDHGGFEDKEETFSFEAELREFKEGEQILQKRLLNVVEGVSAKLLIKTLEGYEL